MKISPKKYAMALADLLESEKEPEQVIRSFLKGLQRRRQMRRLPAILSAFEEEWRLRKGIVKLIVEFPQEHEDSVGVLKELVGKKLGHSVDIEARPGTALIGGFRVKIDDLLIDASLRGMLTRLAGRLSS